MHEIGGFLVVFASTALGVFLPIGIVCWQLDRLTASAKKRGLWRCTAILSGSLLWFMLQTLTRGPWMTKSASATGLLIVVWSWSLYLAGFGFFFGFLYQEEPKPVAQESKKGYWRANVGAASMIIFLLLYMFFNQYIPMPPELRTYLRSLTR